MGPGGKKPGAHNFAKPLRNFGGQNRPSGGGRRKEPPFDTATDKEGLQPLSRRNDA